MPFAFFCSLRGQPVVAGGRRGRGHPRPAEVAVAAAGVDARLVLLGVAVVGAAGPVGGRIQGGRRRTTNWIELMIDH